MPTIEKIVSHYSNTPKLNVTGVTINGRQIHPEYRCKLVARVGFMHGDADGYETVELAFSLLERAKLIEFLQFAVRCSLAYPHGKGGCDNYSHVEGYSNWVYDEDDDDFIDDGDDEEGITHDEEPRNWQHVLEWPMLEGEYYASFKSVEVVYYSETGQEYNVTIDHE